MLPVKYLGDGFALRPVLIFPGEKGNKIIERKDAQLVERLRLFLAYSLNISYVSIQISHDHSV